MRFPVDMFPVMFAIPRTSGWLAQWVELLEDEDQKSRARGRSTWAIKRETTFRYRRGKAGDRLLDHSSSDLLQKLRANSAGDVQRIHPRIELHDVRAHDRAFDPLNQIDRLARGHPPGSR